MDVRIGCSGFSYRHWRGPWYPPDLPANRWFAFYAERFGTVEINASFYRFPTASTVDRWRHQAPEGFAYTIKSPRLITHLKRFAGCGALLDDFYGAVAGLGPHLGCVLFQLPPNLRHAPETLDGILAALRPGFRNIVEFRHASWWRETVFATLRQSGIGFCSVAAAGLPDELIVTGDEAYLRLHGDPWYAQDFGEAELAAWAARIRALDAEHHPQRIWIYFNNDAQAFAPKNAEALRRLLAG